MEDSLPPGNVGTDYTGWITACCGQGGPYRRSLVAGRVPGGLRFAGDDLRLVQSTAVVGRPTTVETTSFTVQVRDQSGNTARKSFSLTINPPRPLVITNQGDQLAPGRVGCRTPQACSLTVACLPTGPSSPASSPPGCR